MFDVAQKYRIDPYESFFEADHGASLNATVIPMYKKSTTGNSVGINNATHLIEFYGFRCMEGIFTFLCGVNLST